MILCPKATVGVTVPVARIEQKMLLSAERDFQRNVVVVGARMQPGHEYLQCWAMGRLG